MIALTLDLSRVNIRLAKRNALPGRRGEVVGNWRIVGANKPKSESAGGAEKRRNEAQGGC